MIHTQGARPRLLDLFCGAGGAAMGYHLAGLDVLGVDIKPQPHYPFEFLQHDATEFFGRSAWRSWAGGYDAIHASPPCQAYTAQKTAWNARKDHPELIEPTRVALRRTGLPYVIENVPGAPLEEPIILCGTYFGLVATNGQRLFRHRLFEIHPPLFELLPPCQHVGDAIGIYGEHLRFRRRAPGRRSQQAPRADRVRIGAPAMGIDWMEWDELREAIPPAYTEWIGRRLLTQLEIAS